MSEQKEVMEEVEHKIGVKLDEEVTMKLIASVSEKVPLHAVGFTPFLLRTIATINVEAYPLCPYPISPICQLRSHTIERSIFIQMKEIENVSFPMYQSMDDPVDHLYEYIDHNPLFKQKLQSLEETRKQNTVDTSKGVLKCMATDGVQSLFILFAPATPTSFPYLPNDTLILTPPLSVHYGMILLRDLSHTSRPYS